MDIETVVFIAKVVGVVLICGYFFFLCWIPDEGYSEDGEQ